jgi:hypothetical protein
MSLSAALIPHILFVGYGLGQLQRPQPIWSGLLFLGMGLLGGVLCCVADWWFRRSRRKPLLSEEEVGALVYQDTREPITFKITLSPKGRQLLMQLAAKRRVDAGRLYVEAMVEYLHRHG